MTPVFQVRPDKCWVVWGDDFLSAGVALVGPAQRPVGSATAAPWSLLLSLLAPRSFSTESGSIAGLFF